MAYVFYDTETTGTRTAFDQILQFAAIKTDDDLNVVETFNIRCRLLPYIVPAPGALLVTGTTIADITTCPLSHFEMMRQVHAKMHHWSQGGAIFIGWNSIRFDEKLLRQAYYQTLLPVYQTNTNGNGRADTDGAGRDRLRAECHQRPSSGRWQAHLQARFCCGGQQHRPQQRPRCLGGHRRYAGRCSSD